MSESTTAGANSRWRGIFSIVLLVLLFFTAAAANVAIWVQTTISETESFVETFAPLPDDESVAEALGQSIADAAVDPQQAAANIATLLPSDLQSLAVPIANAANELAADIATRIVESDAFDAIWERTLRATHTVVVELLQLRNRLEALVVDVQDAADALNEQLQSLGIDITIPDAPSITVLQSGQSSFIVSTLRFIYTTGWVFPVVFLVLAVAVVFVGTNRRESLRAVGAITAVAMAFDLVMMRIVRGDLAGQAQDGLVANAVRQAWDTVTTALRWQTWIILVLALIVMGLARYAGKESFPTPEAAAFLDQWGTALQVGTIAIALLLLLFGPSITFGLALLVAVAAAVIVVFISWGKRRAETSTP